VGFWQSPPGDLTPKLGRAAQEVLERSVSSLLKSQIPNFIPQTSPKFQISNSPTVHEVNSRNSLYPITLDNRIAQLGFRAIGRTRGAHRVPCASHFLVHWYDWCNWVSDALVDWSTETGVHQVDSRPTHRRYAVYKRKEVRSME
jgi:hypothetical protein